MLLLHLELLLLAHLLEFLEHLLGSADPVRRLLRRIGLRSAGGLDGLRQLLVVVVLVLDDLFLLGVRSAEAGRSTRATCAARCQREFSRSSGFGAAEHDDVISRAVEQGVENFLRIAWSVAAEDALVGAEAIDSHATVGFDPVQNGNEAGVVGVNGEASGGEVDRCRLGGLVEKRRRSS